MLKTVEMIVDFRKKILPHSPLWTALESFRFLGTTISQDLKWDNHIESIVKAQQRLYFLRQLRKFNLPQELLIQFYSAIIESVLCTSITVWFSSATKSDLRRLRGVDRNAEQIIGSTLPTLQELYSSRVSKRSGKIQHTPSLNYYCLVDATELWAPERPDTGTVSSLRQSISWTLGNNGKHTTLLYIIYHTYLFTFQICTYYTCTYIIVYIIYCVCAFCTLPVLYIFILLFVLSVSCPVVVFLLHCGASVTIRNSLCVNIHGNKAHSHVESSTEPRCSCSLKNQSTNNWCYGLSLVGSVFIVCFSFPCCTNLVCSVFEVELRPTHLRPV